MKLGEFFNIRANSLNSLRLLFATLVIVSHSWPVAGFGQDPQFGDLKLGEFSVAAFFAISGYLITGSRLNNDLVSYFRARALRIYPGFWVCLVITAFVAAPIAGAVRGGWTFEEGFSYLYSNVTLLMRQWTIGGTLDGAPWPDAWDGPLWTLIYEFGCYVLIAALFAVRAFRNRWAVLTVFAALTVLSAAHKLGHFPDNTKAVNALLATYFFAGATVFMFRDRIPASPVVFAGALAIGITATGFGWGAAVAPLPIAFACLWISAQFPRLLVEHIGDGSIDISYGVYVYGWVVQQLVVLAALHELGVWAMVTASIIGTVPLALASWFLVEKPALRFKKTRPPIAARSSAA
ncbi:MULTISPECIES: acyltransferase [unclassified Rhodococcus (in: high G+C Gram-positive bacteria)]|uniref:acyltransferase family protein n=1 Tax=unclassified Rhodococcus (in: high G+C Gram-positive bacteria) TaxID=192944 RepID=UPI000B9BAC79|nr:MULTISPECIES: acyltransferase [unclassified Rhodococcus (in: high G+C Gram-positive bacteria)]OZE34098.1 hypothetical protein CH259_18895 [Rhodococcus sp. 05-2254-4]OZE51296.1 hypothetical protein CH261_01580 [Rhodococcus sp. 05-2254-3]OZE52947.1 hypothetical protein CH283_06670 [Rhodococcus sp. 05-2254-2]